MRRGRSTVVFVEAVLAVAATGIAFGTPIGYTVAGVAAVAGIAGLVRRRGRGLADVAAGRLGDPAVPADLAGRHVVDVPTRDGELGVAGDGQGFVVVLDAGSPPAWPLADVLDLAFTDPARPAGNRRRAPRRNPARRRRHRARRRGSPRRRRAAR